jgi:hypothetical protein
MLEHSTRCDLGHLRFFNCSTPLKGFRGPMTILYLSFEIPLRGRGRGALFYSLVDVLQRLNDDSTASFSLFIISVSGWMPRGLAAALNINFEPSEYIFFYSGICGTYENWSNTHEGKYISDFRIDNLVDFLVPLCPRVGHKLSLCWQRKRAPPARVRSYKRECDLCLHRSAAPQRYISEYGSAPKNCKW